MKTRHALALLSNGLSILAEKTKASSKKPNDFRMKYIIVKANYGKYY
jgi:hypothetical protein